MRGARATVRVAGVLVALILALWLVALPVAQAQVGGCPTASGWTRLVAGRDARASSEPAPPWEAFPLRNNGGPTEWLYSLAAGWDAPGVLYAGGQHGLFRSDDCGRTWTTHWQNGWHLRLAAPTESRLYASGLSGVRVSRDAGASFQEGHNFGGEPYGLGSSAADPDVAYIFGWRSVGRDATRVVWQTGDGGKTWKQRSTTRPLGAAMVDANDASIVYVFGDGVIFQSVDGALTFEPFSEFDWLGGPGDPKFRRTPIRHAVTSADGSYWWLAVEDGAFMRSADHGLSWKRVPPMPEATGQTRVPRAMTANPHDPGAFFVLFGGDEVWMYRESPGAQARLPDITEE